MAEKKRYPNHVMKAGEAHELELTDGVMMFVCDDNDEVIEFIASFSDFMAMTKTEEFVLPELKDQALNRLKKAWEALPARTVNCVAEKTMYGLDVDILRGGQLWQNGG